MSLAASSSTYGISSKRKGSRHLVAVIGIGNGHGDNAVVGMPVEVAMPVVAALGVSMVVVVVEMVVAMRHCRSSISGGHGVVMVCGGNRRSSGEYTGNYEKRFFGGWRLNFKPCSEKKSLSVTFKHGEQMQETHMCVQHK